MLPQKYPRRRGVLLVFILSALLYLLAGYGGILGTLTFDSLVFLKLLLLAGSLILPLPAYLYLRHYRYNPRLVFRLNPVGPRLLAVSAALGLALFLVANEIDRLVDLVLPLPEILRALRFIFLRANNWPEWILIILATVILASLFEEMLFRGFVQNAFEKQHKAAHAILLTAFLFASIHGMAWSFLQIFILSVFLGWMAWKSDSIIPGTIVHGLNNLLAVLWLNLQVQPSWLFWRGHINPLLLLAAMGVIYFGFKFFNLFCEEETEIPTFLNTPK